MSSTIGVLAIGSLYWDPDREAWQRSRLSMQDEASVSAPIRYGRLSEGTKRRGTYTMVFSSHLREREFGTAKVLPCVNSVRCLADLLHEAKLLWLAEFPKAPQDAISSDFGCVVLQRNPNGNADDELINDWADYVTRDIHIQNLAHGIEEGRLISELGLLQIPWPNLDSGDAVDLDLLLATTNAPTLKGDPPVYPSAQTIALAWKKALKERPAVKPDDYFWNNRKYGIATFQDEEIERVLNSGSGCLSSLRSILGS